MFFLKWRKLPMARTFTRIVRFSKKKQESEGKNLNFFLVKKKIVFTEPLLRKSEKTDFPLQNFF